MAGDAIKRLRRRAVLAGLVGLPLAGCAPLVFRDLPETDLDAAPVEAVSRMRVVLFELRRIDMPFHAGVVIEAPGETVIYDPSGAWHPSGESRDGDMIRNVTPETVDAYLRRDGFEWYEMGWTAHVFDRAVPHDVARLAIARAGATPPMAPLHCAFGVSQLLSQLPGFEFVHRSVIPGELFAALRAAPGFDYSRDVLE